MAVTSPALEDVLRSAPPPCRGLSSERKNYVRGSSQLESRKKRGSVMEEIMGVNGEVNGEEGGGGK